MLKTRSVGTLEVLLLIFVSGMPVNLLYAQNWLHSDSWKSDRDVKEFMEQLRTFPSQVAIKHTAKEEKLQEIVEITAEIQAYIDLIKFYLPSKNESVKGTSSIEVLIATEAGSLKALIEMDDPILDRRFRAEIKVFWEKVIKDILSGYGFPENQTKNWKNKKEELSAKLTELEDRFLAELNEKKERGVHCESYDEKIQSIRLHLDDVFSSKSSFHAVCKARLHCVHSSSVVPNDIDELLEQLDAVIIRYDTLKKIRDVPLNKSIDRVFKLLEHDRKKHLAVYASCGKGFRESLIKTRKKILDQDLFPDMGQAERDEIAKVLIDFLKVNLYSPTGYEELIDTILSIEHIKIREIVESNFKSDYQPYFEEVLGTFTDYEARLESHVSKIERSWKRDIEHMYFTPLGASFLQSSVFTSMSDALKAQSVEPGDLELQLSGRRFDEPRKMIFEDGPFETELWNDCKMIQEVLKIDANSFDVIFFVNTLPRRKDMDDIEPDSFPLICMAAANIYDRYGFGDRLRIKGYESPDIDDMSEIYFLKTTPDKQGWNYSLLKDYGGIYIYAGPFQTREKARSWFKEYIDEKRIKRIGLNDS